MNTLKAFYQMYSWLLNLSMAFMICSAAWALWAGDRHAAYLRIDLATFIGVLLVVHGKSWRRLQDIDRKSVV